jgi:virginiamycin B lyase
MRRLRSLAVLLFALCCLGVVLLVSVAAAAAPTITEYRFLGSYLGGIVAGPDGNLWFTGENADRIGKITPGGHVTEYSAGIAPFNELDAIVAGRDGNLWFTDSGGGRIGKITTTGHVTEYRPGILYGSSPTGIAAGPDGNIWFTELVGGRIGRVSLHVTTRGKG